jgi:hypothetical protein
LAAQVRGKGNLTMSNYTTLSVFDERLIKGQSMEFKVAAFFLSQHLSTHWLPLPKEGIFRLILF